ncbi:MAG: sialate O-acetylesterase, partial [Verrucomicrobiota bacterium]
MFSNLSPRICLALGVLCATISLQAAETGPRPLALQMGAPFHDHAVLQRGMKVPVWGWSRPGTKVTVRFAGQTRTATAGEDGKWLLHLDPLKANAEPAEMVIREEDGKIEVLKDLLVGEVWMASGQSNMQWKAGKSKVSQLAEQLAAETEGNGVPIREFEVTSVTSQLHPIKKATGSWKNGAYSDYSAIAFAFAHKLYKTLDVPVGILNCSWSQTPIQAWVPREGYATATDDYSKAIHRKCLMTDPTTPEHQEAWAAFYQSLEDQIAASEAAIEKGEKAKAIHAPVPGNLKGNRDANWLFN